MFIPEPVEEGAVKIHWIQSTEKADRVKAIFEIDFGKTEMTPSQAGAVHQTIIATLKLAFGVKLSRFKSLK